MKKETRAGDLRVQKTYDALARAFLDILQEKRFEDITVRELCDRARIRTATFYTHFTDKYDYFAFLVRKTRQEFWDGSASAVLHTSPEDYLLGVIRSGLDFLERNETFICMVEDNVILAPTMHLLSHEMRAQICSQLQQIADQGTALTAPPQILAELFVGAVSQISHWWFAHRKECSKDQMAEILCPVVLRMVFLQEDAPKSADEVDGTAVGAAMGLAKVRRP